MTTTTAPTPFGVRYIDTTGTVRLRSFVNPSERNGWISKARAANAITVVGMVNPEPVAPAPADETAQVATSVAIEFSVDGGASWKFGGTYDGSLATDSAMMADRRAYARDMARGRFGSVDVATRVTIYY